MRNFKRFLTLALAVVMVASMFAFGASAAQFTDVDENNEYLTKSVNLLNHIGVAKGTSDTTFGTEELVTREQMAAFIYRLMKRGNSVEGGANASRFTDLEDPTFFFMISWADSQGIIKGTSATTFEPKGSITLQDAYTMIVRALGYEKEESLPYPFGYIGVAEDKGVELDEGLSSDVSYTDALTRGDVAILLYNAFFAETGVAETKQVERELSDGSIVLETKTDYPTLAEKVYDVIEVEYQAVATPKYAFGDETETTSGLGYDAVLFDKVDGQDSDTVDAPAQFYADVKDLAIDGSADDYIMGHFNMFVTLDDDNDIDEILYAESLMTKKSVSDIKLETLTSNTKNSYYDGNSKYAKRLSGKAIVDGKDVYFYNAPYSYAKPTYGTKWTDAQKYNERNADNIKFIERAILGTDKDDHEYTFKYVDEDMFVTYAAGDEVDDNCVIDSETLVNVLKQVYTGGLYEAVVYDVDGDGLYDYINYMPYSFAFVDTDDDYNFYDDNESGFVDDGGKPTVYTNEAVVEGESFKDEDLVLGYFDAAANYIKVAQVVEPIKATVSDIKTSTSTLTLSTGDKVSVKDAWKLVANFNAAADLEAVGYVVDDVDWAELADANGDMEALLGAGSYDSDAAEFYVYGGAILFQDGIDNDITFDGKLIVVTEDEDGNWIETGSFNSATGERTTYVYAWVDGALKWVAIDTEADVWPELKESNKDIYLNKVGTYSVDSNGLYTIKLLGNAYDDKAMDEDSYIGINKDIADLDDDKDDSLQYLFENDGTSYLTKNVGKRFKTTGFNRDLVLDSKSIILIRNEYEDDGDTVVDFVQYSVNELTESIENSLTNVQVVVSNNIDYTNRENLVLYFAETSDGKEINIEGKTTTKSDRIVKMMNPKMNADKKYYYEYTVYNPYTGETETINGNKTDYGKSGASRYTYGDVVEINSTGLIEDKKDTKKGSALPNSADLYWIIDYDADSKVIEIAKLPTSQEEVDAIDNGTAKTIRLNVEDVVVSKANGGSGADMIKWGSFAKAAVADLGSDKKDFKATATWSKKDTDPLKTVYGKYIKAYIDIDWEDKNNHDALNDDTNCNGDANYVTIIVNSAEPTYRCDLK